MTAEKLKDIIFDAVSRAVQKFLSLKRGKLLVVLPENSVPSEQYMEFIKRNYSDYLITYLAKDTSFGTPITLYSENREDSAYVEKHLTEYVKVIYISPSLDFIREVTKGREDTLQKRILVYAALHKLECEVLLDFDLKDLPPSAFLKNVSDTLSGLTDMGITQTKITSQEEESQNPFEGLLTEDQIEQAAKNGDRSILIENDTIVTPLADERAEELGILIRRTQK